jgi:hypothetical protein
VSCPSEIVRPMSDRDAWCTKRGEQGACVPKRKAVSQREEQMFETKEPSSKKRKVDNTPIARASAQ